MTAIGRKTPSTAFESILYEAGAAAAERAPREPPAYFRDLNLDQVIDAIVAGRDEYDLKPFFYDNLPTSRAVEYRHEILRDLDDAEVCRAVRLFGSTMAVTRQHVTQSGKLYYKQQKEWWLLHAVDSYCAAVDQLKRDLACLDISSTGLVGFRDYLTAYSASPAFAELWRGARRLKAGLASVSYSVLIWGNGFTVRAYDDEQDYSAEVASVFDKFRQGDVKDYRVSFNEYVEMNHIEAKVLEFVALLNPDLFTEVEQFCAKAERYADEIVANFDREIQFYTAFIDYTAPFRQAGLPFCYPVVSMTDKQVSSEDGFDLALATKLARSSGSIIRNDFHIEGQERVFVVSGPNQGGKTTFARTFGQLHHLASIGCQVPGRAARLFLFDKILTHFEREEDITNLRGKLQDDLIRIRDILKIATPRSIVIMNEIFNSTALRDAVFLAGKVMEAIIALDCLCVCVSFLDELATMSNKAVSMVSMVTPDNPAVRTFKVIRRPNDGQAYAISIAEKYRLTYECLLKRLPMPQSAP